MDLNIFNMFLATEIMFIIDTLICPSLDPSIWLLNHFDTIIVGLDSFFLFSVIFTLIMYISVAEVKSVISLRDPASF